MWTSCGQGFTLRTKHYPDKGMVVRINEVSKMSKAPIRDYLAELDRQDAEDDLNLENAEKSEVEQLASLAPGPKPRSDGTLRGLPKQRPLTIAQQAFINNIISGMTMKDAYKAAYPNDTSSDQIIASSAYKLSRHPRVSQMLNDAWGQTVEALSDDLAAARRYVLRELVAHSRNDKQEGSRLKALELLGKASGVFTQSTSETAPVVTADQLKKELSGHLRLLDNTKKKA
jgi:hypothetical protein